MSLLRRPIVVLDTETTGLQDVPWSRVVELAAVIVDCDGTIAPRNGDRYESLVRPEVHDARSAGAERVHGLTIADLATARLAGEVAEEFLDWLGGAPVTSFNVAFDRPMVERMGLDGLRWGSCIMERAMEQMGPAGVLRPADPTHPRYVPGREWLWPSLAAAADFYAVPVVGNAHRALTGATTAAGVLVAILRRDTPTQESP